MSYIVGIVSAIIAILFGWGKVQSWRAGRATERAEAAEYAMEEWQTYSQLQEDLRDADSILYDYEREVDDVETATEIIEYDRNTSNW
jgi:uncharacterized membrane protein